MGEAAPPMLDARAIPRMRAFEKLESDGRLRRRGLQTIRRSPSILIAMTYLDDRET